MRALTASLLAVSLSCASQSPSTPKTEAPKAEAPKAPAASAAPTKPPAPKPEARPPAKPKPEPKPAAKAKKQPKKKESGAVNVKTPALPAKTQADTAADQKLDDRLLQLVKASRGGGATAAEAKAKALSLYEKESLVKVEITAVNNDGVPAIKKEIETGKGELIVDLANHIFALVPTSLIEPLSKLPAVYTIASTANTVRQ